MDRPFRAARATSHSFKSGGVRKMVFGCFDTFIGLSPSSFICHTDIRYSDQPLSQIARTTSSGETMGRPPSPDKDRFIVRLPDGMRDQISAAARANDRTMTAEIVTRLRMSFEAEGLSPAGQSALPRAEEIADLKSQLRVLTRKLNEIDTRTQHLLPAKKK